MDMPTDAPPAAPTDAAPDEESPDTITVPRSVLGDRECRPGERLTFVVVDSDEDGAEVKLADSGYSKGGGEHDDMADYPMET